MRIEPITADNVVYAVQLAKEMHGMSSFASDGPEFEWSAALGNFISITHLPKWYFRLAFDDKEQPCGAVLGHLENYIFNPATFAVEDAWFVRPETENRTKIGKALMIGFIGWAIDENNALCIQSGDVASIETVAVQGLYTHLGFKRYGSIYRYARENV